MSSEILYAILFGGLALLAQYLPAKWGIPIGLDAIALSIWQLGLGGWPLWLAIALTALVVWRIFSQHGLFEKHSADTREQRKAKAQEIHVRIMALDSALENTKAGLPSEGNWQENPEVRQNLDKLQAELNNLGYIVNNRDYDRWAEEFMLSHAQKLEYQYTSHHDMDEWGRARLNAKFREFINKVKG